MEVLSAGADDGRHDVFISQHLPDHKAQVLHHTAVKFSGRDALADMDFRLRPVGSGSQRGAASELLLQLRHHLVGLGAHVKTDLRLVRYDVDRLSSPEKTRDLDGMADSRVHADHVDRVHNSHRRLHGVDPLLGPGPVSGPASDNDVRPAAGAVVHRRGSLAEAQLLLRADMQSHHLVHVVRKPAVDDAFRACQRLLRGLENDLEPAAGNPPLRQHPGRCHDHGAMGIVAAGVPRHIFPVDHVGQGVHVCPERHGFSRPSAVQNPDHPRFPAHIADHLKTAVLQLRRKEGRGLVLLHPQLRVAVEEFKQFVHIIDIYLFHTLSPFLTIAQRSRPPALLSRKALPSGHTGTPDIRSPRPRFSGICAARPACPHRSAGPRRPACR